MVDLREHSETFLFFLLLEPFLLKHYVFLKVVSGFGESFSNRNTILQGSLFEKTKDSPHIIIFDSNMAWFFLLSLIRLSPPEKCPFVRLLARNRRPPNATFEIAGQKPIQGRSFLFPLTAISNIDDFYSIQMFQSFLMVYFFPLNSPDFLFLENLFLHLGVVKLKTIGNSFGGLLKEDNLLVHAQEKEITSRKFLGHSGDGLDKIGLFLLDVVQKFTKLVWIALDYLGGWEGTVLYFLYLLVEGNVLLEVLQQIVPGDFKFTSGLQQKLFEDDRLLDSMEI